MYSNKKKRIEVKHKSDSTPLWVNENKDILEKRKENEAPICPLCKKHMVKQKFADDTIGYSCDCLHATNKKDTRDLIHE